MLCDEIALYLLRDASIADHLENVAYNALPQQLLPDGRGQVYFTMQNQIMANLGSHGFTSDGGGIVRFTVCPEDTRVVCTIIIWVGRCLWQVCGCPQAMEA